jgi:hypothetical protein
MFNLFDKTFFRFLLGFTFILVASLGVLFFVGYHELRQEKAKAVVTSRSR